jgi:PTS system nitrogen regulatory IIA component
MDDFSDILSIDTVLADLAVTNKKALLQQVAAAAVRVVPVEPRIVTDRLADRERLGSTGFGAGVAIPHGKIEGLERVTGVFAKLAAPIDFAAIDDIAVDIVFVLLSPPDAGVDHLKALARVSRALRDRTFVAKLRGAGSRDALFALLAGGATPNAA